ncbi:mediator complex, subunit Med18 [Immersiella caudata]|uniref:Mediator of RNA polymerase II transcription subunit 18 n=1 Tax=Immersiella caudata TaxID=314043 RepID=A0AA39X360_9PEZI|nr:mediator complex, subunit Med18 [Immersiella caudata]
MPHEVFLTAVVKDADAIKARGVLAGITEMKERHHYLLVRHLERDAANRDPKILNKLKEYQKERGPNAARWQEFQQILAKQEYIIQEHIDVTREVGNANGGEISLTFPPSKPHLLRWNDIPDPPGKAFPEFITQRRILEISDPRLEKILPDIKFVPRSTCIEESYKWWLDNLEYSLTKYIPIPPGQTPNLAALEPVVPFWILYVRSQTDSSPERMKESQIALAGVRERLLGVFDFKAFDRRAHDTRIMGQR